MHLSVGPYLGDGSSWDAFVASHPDSTNYHQYRWRQVIERSFGHQTQYLAARDRSGAICGILPAVLMRSRLFGSFLVSLPFLNYGGMLCHGQESEEHLLHSCRTLLEQHQLTHAELRHLTRSAAITATRQHKVSMLLELAETEQQQWQWLDPKVRNQIRKAGRAGLQPRQDMRNCWMISTGSLHATCVIWVLRSMQGSSLQTCSTPFRTAPGSSRSNRAIRPWLQVS